MAMISRTSPLIRHKMERSCCSLDNDTSDTKSVDHMEVESVSGRLQEHKQLESDRQALAIQV